MRLHNFEKYFFRSPVICSSQYGTSLVCTVDDVGKYTKCGEPPNASGSGIDCLMRGYSIDLK